MNFNTEDGLEHLFLKLIEEKVLTIHFARENKVFLPLPQLLNTDLAQTNVIPICQKKNPFLSLT